MAAEDEASTSHTESEVRGESGELQGAPDSDSSANPGSPGIEPKEQNKEQKPERKQIVCDPRINILLEEWKKNVDLYIDQDKRGFERINMFLLVHAGLLVFFGTMWRVDESLYLEAFYLKICAAVFGVVITVLTWCMSISSHAFIHLRRTQGMLIERALRAILYAKGGEGKTPIDIDQDSGMPVGDPVDCQSAIISTFSRELVAFRKEGEAYPEWLLSFRDEITNLSHVSQPFMQTVCPWKCSIRHLTWLKWMFGLLVAVWVALVLLTLFVPHSSKAGPVECAGGRQIVLGTNGYGMYGIFSDDKSPSDEPDATTPPYRVDATTPPSKENDPSSPLQQPSIGDSGKMPTVCGGQQMVVTPEDQQMIETAGGQQIVPSTMELAIQGLRQELNDLRTHFDQQWKGIERIEATLNELRGKTPVGTTPPAN